jgi:tetratricopeptide (TPR) repeat protein
MKTDLKRSALAIVLLLAGCQSRGPLPALPKIDTGAFLPAIRDAIEPALQEASARPDDPLAVGRLGMLLHAHQQFGAARDCYRRAAVLDSKNFDWQYYLGLTAEGTEAITALRNALRIREHLPARLKLGESLLSAGDGKAAREVYRGVQHPAALFGLGRATGDAAYYETAIAAFPQYGAAIFALAQHYQRSGRVDDAKRLMTDYEKYKMVAPPLEDTPMAAIRALNQGPDALLREAADLDAQGRLQEAAELQLKALALDPKLAQAHINLVSLYGRMRDAAGAEKHYREAIAVAPNADEAFYNFGVFCYQSNRRAEAKAAFQKAIAINPGRAGAHNNLGMLLQEEGKLEDAARHFVQAVQSQPDLRLAHFHLGRIYANQKRLGEAIAHLERAAGVDDESTPTFLYALGATYARAGNREKASAVLATARERAAARGQAALAATIGKDLERLR